MKIQLQIVAQLAALDAGRQRPALDIAEANDIPIGRGGLAALTLC